MDSQEYLNALVVFIVIAAAAYNTTYVIHRKYMLPFHSDEWDHLTIGKELFKTGSIDSIMRVNPYIGIPYTGYWVNLETGFHVLTAVLLDFTGVEVTRFGVLMPTLIVAFLSLNAYVLVRYLTKSMIAGIISAVYSATLKSNVTFLGPWFYVPSSLGLSFAPLFLYLFLRTLKSNKTINSFDPPLVLLFAVVGLIHPPSVSVLLPIFIVYLVFNPKTLRENKSKILLAMGGGGIILVSMLFVMSIPLSVLSNPGSFLSRYLVFTGSDYNIRIMYSYPAYLGYTVILFVVVGVYASVSSENREEWILPLAVLSLLPLAVQFYRTGSVFLSPYRRIFFYNAEIMLLTAGLGLYYICNQIFCLLRASSINVGIKFVLDISFMAFVFYLLTLQAKSTLAYSEKLYHVIEEKDVEPLLWLKENTPEDSIVLARVQISQAVTPIAERKVVGKVRTFLRVPMERLTDAETFFNVGCTKKKTLADKYNVSYVFGPRISCDFLKLVHAENGNYIYKAQLE